MCNLVVPEKVRHACVDGLIVEFRGRENHKKWCVTLCVLEDWDVPSGICKPLKKMDVAAAMSLVMLPLQGVSCRHGDSR